MVMQLYMLYEETRLGPIPEGIKIVHDFGRVQIRTHGTDRHVVGTSLVLAGPPQIFVDWLKHVDGFWVGQGQPCEEQFRIAHIKEANAC